MTEKSATSLTLLERIRAGDRSGWRNVVELYAPLVHYWCRRFGIEQADADDVAQEVFQAASQDILQFHRDRAGDTFRGWLRGITRYKALAFWRGRERERLADPVGGSEAWHRLQEIPEDELATDTEESAQLSALFHRAVQLLRDEFEDRTWQAFWRTAVDDQPAAAVAQELGMTANAVRMAKSRVLHRLRTELGDLVE